MDGLPGTLLTRLNTAQLDQLQRMEAAFRDWNSKVNLVSRKDMDAFVAHHLVHSLALVLFVDLPERCRVLDVGTGGGLPGLPLAICFPHAQFHLCDSIRKKALAVEGIVAASGVRNVTVINKRAELLESTWHYVLGRAVTSLPRFLSWIRKNIRPAAADSALPNGVFYWKGSLWEEELASVGIEPLAVHTIGERLDDPYFEGKYIVHLSRESVLRAKLPEVE
jgi:16S rRNA (guanine527-N7)-methyltransferase